MDKSTASRCTSSPIRIRPFRQDSKSSSSSEDRAAPPHEDYTHKIELIKRPEENKKQEVFDETSEDHALNKVLNMKIEFPSKSLYA